MNLLWVGYAASKVVATRGEMVLGWLFCKMPLYKVRWSVEVNFSIVGYCCVKRDVFEFK